MPIKTTEIKRPEVAPFAQVYKGEGGVEFWLLRIGPQDKNEYLFKVWGKVEHPWRGKIFSVKKDGREDRSDWYMKHGNSDRWVTFVMKKTSTFPSYEAYLEGRKDAIKVQLDEKLSRGVNPESFLTEYLDSKTQKPKAA